METSSAKDLIGLLAERSSAWQSVWNLFYTVSAAMIVFATTINIPPQYNIAASTVMVTSFLLFAAGNYRLLDQICSQRMALAEFVKAKASGDPYIIAFAEASLPPSKINFRAYHWGLCAFIVCLILLAIYFHNK